MICPNSLEDLKYIAAALNDDILMENAEKIFGQAEIVKRAHIRAGFAITEKLRNSEEIKNYVKLYEEKGYLSLKKATIQLDNIGEVVLLKVVDIGDYFECPASFCNHRQVNY
jgi:hypothetical protein